MLACAGASQSRNACYLVPWGALTVGHSFCVAVGCRVFFQTHVAEDNQMRLLPTHTWQPHNLPALCRPLQRVHGSGQAAHQPQLLPPELGGARAKRCQRRRGRGPGRGRAPQAPKQVRGHRGRRESSWEAWRGLQHLPKQVRGHLGRRQSSWEA